MLYTVCVYIFVSYGDWIRREKITIKNTFCLQVHFANDTYSCNLVSHFHKFGGFA